MAICALPGGWLHFRPLTGHDERSVEGTTILDALALIDRLNSGRTGALVTPGDAAMLTAPARDRALAGIYAQTYGDAIASSPICSRCGERYDLSFSLAAMLAAYPVTLAPDGAYQSATGIRFRLPTGMDELAVIGLTPEAARGEILRRCTLGETADPAVLEAAMEAVAPLLNTEIDATCPECGAHQIATFDMGLYLLRRLVSDQARLPREVHTLAIAYGWGHDDILSLTRSERKSYLALIEAGTRDRTAHRAGRSRRRLEWQT